MAGSVAATALATGLTERDVASNVLVSLSSSFQTTPNFWLNPKNGVSYSLAVQTPQRLVSNMMDLSNTVVTSARVDDIGATAAIDRVVAAAGQDRVDAR